MGPNLNSSTSLRAPLLNPDAHSKAQVLSALSSSLAEQNTIFASDSRRYAIYLRSLVRTIAPYVGQQLISENGKQLCNELHKTFEVGQELTAFRTLVSGLDDNTYRARALVQILESFLTRRTIEAVIDQSETEFAEDVVPMVVHLKSRVLNALLGMSNADLWNDSLYVEFVADALLDSNGGVIAGRIAEGLIRSGEAERMVRRWRRRADGVPKASKILKLIGERPQGTLIRAIAEEGDERMLEELFKIRGIDTAVRVVLLKRPLLSRVAIASIVAAVYKQAPESSPKAMRIIFSQWASEDLATKVDLKLQRQITRTILHVLHHIERERLQSVDSKPLWGESSIDLAYGTHHRLTHGDVRIRRYGMLVAEAASRSAGDDKPLKFDQKDYAKCYENLENTSDDEQDLYEMAREGLPIDTVTTQQEPASTEEPERDDIPEKSWTSWEVRVQEWHDGDDAASDDWSSLDGYSVSSDEDGSADDAGNRRLIHGDIGKLRESVSSPVSVIQVLTMLRTVAGGGDESLKYKADTVASAMRMIAVDTKKSLPTLKAYAPELARVILGIESERFPEEFYSSVDSAKKDALLELLCLDIRKVGGMMIEDVICGAYAVVRKRIYALRLLTDAARILSRKVKRVDRTGLEERQLPVSKKLGKTVRRLEKSLEKAGSVEKEIQNDFSNAAEDLFYSLANGIDTGGGADFIDLENQDTSIAAQALATLAVFVSCAGPQCLARSQLSHSLIDLSMAWKTNKDPTIRRAVAIALGSAADAFSSFAFDDSHILRVHGGKGDAVQWLEAASSGDDSDEFVRQLAGKALNVWMAKMSELSTSNMQTLPAFL